MSGQKAVHGGHRRSLGPGGPVRGVLKLVIYMPLESMIQETDCEPEPASRECASAGQPVYLLPPTDRCWKRSCSGKQYVPHGHAVRAREKRCRLKSSSPQSGEIRQRRQSRNAARLRPAALRSPVSRLQTADRTVPTCTGEVLGTQRTAERLVEAGYGDVLRAYRNLPRTQYQETAPSFCPV